MVMNPPTRRPARRPVPEGEEVRSAPATSGRTTRILGHGALGVLVGLGAVVAAPMSPLPVVVAVAGVLVAVASVMVALVADRAGRRRDLMSGLAEALGPVVGTTSRGRVRLSTGRWAGGWTGHPTTLRIGYSGRASSHDPAWTTQILDLCTRRVDAGVRYTVTRHDARTRRLDLSAVDPALDPPVEQDPVLQQRATEYLTQVIGPSTRVESVEWSEDRENLVALEISHSAGARLASSGYQRRVESVVNNTLPGRWRAHWDLEQDKVRFEVRPSFPASVWMPADPVQQTGDVLSSYDQVEIAYGVDEDGNEMTWRPARDPHMMLVGSSGTGKTVTAHGVLVGITRRSWPVWVLDGKGIEFLGYRGWPGVQIVATRVQEQVALLHRAHQLMEHRYELIVEGRKSEADFEPLVVVIDEWADFRGNLLEWYAGVKQKGDPTKPACLAMAASIARKGRSARVHLLFGTQRPDAEYFGGDMRDNFRMRISMGRLSPQGAMMMWENPAVGVHLPRGCRGRATTINEMNRPVEIQTYRTPDPRRAVDPEDLALLRQLRPPSSTHDRLVYLPPESRRDLDTSEEIPLGYRDYAFAGWGRATEHPELDPLSGQSGADGRADASPSSIFDLTPSSLRPSRSLSSSSASPVGLPSPERAGPQPGAPEVGGKEPADKDPVHGYGPAEEVPVDEVEPGWLVMVDADTQQWAVVESEPEPDPFDEGVLSLAWRGDDDQAGVLAVEDQSVLARRPTEED